VAPAIRDGTAIAISDGSFKDGFGTSALVIEASDSTDNIIAVNVVPGNLADQGSYRSELAGIFGQITLVNTLCNVHGITQGPLSAVVMEPELSIKSLILILKPKQMAANSIYCPLCALLLRPVPFNGNTAIFKDIRTTLSTLNLIVGGLSSILRWTASPKCIGLKC
jgi:hypothetical protein